MKFGQLIEYNKINIFLQKAYRNAINLAYNKNKLYKTLEYRSRDTLNFSERGLEIVSHPHFMYDFSRKMFLILYSIN